MNSPSKDLNSDGETNLSDLNCASAQLPSALSALIQQSDASGNQIRLGSPVRRFHIYPNFIYIYIINRMLKNQHKST